MEQVKRITKAQRMDDIKALLVGEPTTYGTTVEAAIEFLTYEQGLLARKNASGEKKPTKTQEENVIHKERIVEFLMGREEGVTVTSILKGVPTFADFSNQKVARLVKDLVDAGRVKKEIVKGKALFTLA